MRFVVFQCQRDRDMFVVTDDAHADKLPTELTDLHGRLERVGAFPEMGRDRVAFDETLAKNSIAHQGYYLFEARSFDAVAEAPTAMPV